jgi:hypothetical protein
MRHRATDHRTRLIGSFALLLALTLFVTAGTGLPGAAEQKRTLTRPVCWTLCSSLRPIDMAEILGIVSIIVGEPTRFP